MGKVEWFTCKTNKDEQGGMKGDGWGVGVSKIGNFE